MTSSNERQRYALPRGAKRYLDSNPDAVLLLRTVYAHNGEWVNSKDIITELGIPEEQQRQVSFTLMKLYNFQLIYSEFYNPYYRISHHRIRRFRSGEERSEQIHKYLESAGGDTA